MLLADSQSSRHVRRGHVTVVLSVAVALVALVGCSSSKSTSTSTSSAAVASSGGSSSAASNLNLPASIPLTLLADKTGPDAFYGAQLTAGVQAGIDHVNNSGELGKSKFVLTVQDTQSLAATATTLASAAVHSNIPLLLGPSISNEALATTPIAQAAKMPYFVQTSPPGVLDAGDYIYSTTTPEQSQTTTLVSALAPKLKTVSIIYADDNPTMNSLGPATATAFTAAGSKVNTSIGVPIAATDYSAAVTKAISSNPDGVGIISGGPMMSSVTKALSVAGYKGQIFGPEGADGTIDAAGTAANGFEFTTEWAPDLPGAANTQFQAEMAKLSPSLAIHYPAVDGYTEVLFAALAIEKADSIDPAKVLTGLQQVSAAGFSGPGGDVKFGGDGNRQLQGPAVLVQFNNGKTSRVSS